MEAHITSKQLLELLTAQQLGKLSELPIELRTLIYRLVHAPIDKIDFPAIKKREGIAQDKGMFMAVWLFSVKLEELDVSDMFGTEMGKVLEKYSKNFAPAALIQLFENHDSSAACFTAHLAIEDLGAVDYTALEEVKICFPRQLAIEFSRLVPQTDKYYLSYAIYPSRGAQQFPVLELFPDGRGVTIRSLLVDDDCPNLTEQCNNESPSVVCLHGGQGCACTLITIFTPMISIQADSALGPLTVHNNIPPLTPWEHYNVLPRWSLACHKRPLYHYWITIMLEQLGPDAVWISPSGDICRSSDIGL
ncbi:uncharacterized protein BP5553_07518 [Venustampulla echinocandica]|uniref:Uncharacterized protein n=1 Tax=Venustampulla echinocandica TaxID=2656787 RepID=A0A370TGT4_9HELO|nr:uncharacterized protein BP5553_07518 [Venustampulla echinocandica]RDL34390.1 hypothetical protein BP5553_07518 [Venustampulla echinocandica]